MFNGSKEVRERVDALEKKVATLQEAHDVLNRRMSLEWEELLDKVHRWMQRTSARSRTEAKAAATVDQADGLDPISRQLIARRSRGAPVRSVPQLSEEGDGETGS